MIYMYIIWFNGLVVLLVVDGLFVGIGDVIIYSYFQVGDFLFVKNGFGQIIMYEGYNNLGLF